MPYGDVETGQSQPLLPRDPKAGSWSPGMAEAMMPHTRNAVTQAHTLMTEPRKMDGARLQSAHARRSRARIRFSGRSIICSLRSESRPSSAEPELAHGQEAFTV